MEEENHIYEHRYESDDEEINEMEGLIIELIYFTINKLIRNSFIEKLRSILFINSFILKDLY